jgi:rsbT co-antagonist protein RsbR
MAYHQFMSKLKLDEQELASRLAFFEIGEEDLRRLASLRGFAEKYTDEIVEDLYVLILGHAESRQLFLDERTVGHVKAAQRQYFRGLFSGACDLGYVEDRLRIGVAHERVGVPPKWYLGAYARYMRLIFDRLRKELGDGDALNAAFRSIQKLVAFDTALAMDTYIASQLDTLARHQAAIREMSTPVIEVYERVLLMPLIGTIDTQRAEQVMEAVLLKVVEKQARVIILDIAGVSVIDTKVADHLLKTTEAVALLGAQTILTGISPLIAKTIVRLGMDISAMHTRSRLADGITLALELIGAEIRHVAKAKRRTRKGPARGSSSEEE